MKKIAMILSVIFLASCAVSSGKYDVLTTKNINVYSVKKNSQIVFRDAESTSSQHVLVLLPIGKYPTISSAVNEVLSRYNGDYLANVEIKNRSFQIMWLYHYTSWEIIGDVVKIR